MREGLMLVQALTQLRRNLANTVHGSVSASLLPLLKRW
jgi:hypothetical protein